MPAALLSTLPAPKAAMHFPGASQMQKSRRWIQSPPLGPWKPRRRKRGSVLQGELGYNMASSPHSDVGCAAHHLETFQDFSGSRLCPSASLFTIPEGNNPGRTEIIGPWSTVILPAKGLMLSSDQKPSAHGAKESFYGTNNRSEAKLPHFFKALKMAPQTEQFIIKLSCVPRKIDR